MTIKSQKKKKKYQDKRVRVISLPQDFSIQNKTIKN